MSEAGKEAVLSVFATMVRPLMRVAFEYGISAGEISGVVRRAYIEALEKRLQEQKRPTTDARLAAVSGLARSEVSAVREALRTGAPHSLRASLTTDQISTLLTVWHTHPNFSGAYGLALDLDLTPTPGSPRRAFRDLVREAFPNADADAVLDELVAAGSVEIIDETTVRCVSRAFVPRGADVKRIERMGRFLGVVTANFVHNLLRNEDQPAYFERLVMSDYPLSDSDRDEFLAVARDRGQALLSELDTFLAGLQPGDPASGKRYGVGIYFFEEQPSVVGLGAKDDDADVAPRRNTKSNQPEEIDVLAPAFRQK